MIQHSMVCLTGDITSRLTSDTTQVSDLISQNVNLFLRSFVKSVGIFIFMFGMSWKLSVVTIMGFPYIAVVSKLYGEYYKASYAYANTLLDRNNRKWCIVVAYIVSYAVSFFTNTHYTVYI